MRTTFRGVRANLPAYRNAARLGRGRRSCFTVVQVVVNKKRRNEDGF